MNPTRMWTLGAAVAIVAILAGAVGLGIQPQLAAASAADVSSQGVREQNGTTQIQLAELSRAAAKQSALTATDSVLSSAITSTLRLSTFSRQIRNVAALDGVTLTSLAPGAPLTYAPAVGSASTGVAASSPAPGAAATGVFGTTRSAITATNFTLIPVSVVVTGSEAASMQFASDVQHLTRLFAVNTVSYSAATAGNPPTTTLSGSIYALQR